MDLPEAAFKSSDLQVSSPCCVHIKVLKPVLQTETVFIADAHICLGGGGSSARARAGTRCRNTGAGRKQTTWRHGMPYMWQHVQNMYWVSDSWPASLVCTNMREKVVIPKRSPAWMYVGIHIFPVHGCMIAYIYPQKMWHLDQRLLSARISASRFFPDNVEMIPRDSHADRLDRLRWFSMFILAIVFIFAFLAFHTYKCIISICTCIQIYTWVCIFKTHAYVLEHSLLYVACIL